MKMQHQNLINMNTERPPEQIAAELYPQTLVNDGVHATFIDVAHLQRAAWLSRQPEVDELNRQLEDLKETIKVQADNLDYALNEAAQVGYERGFKDGDARDIQNQYVIEHTQAGALALLQKLTHHNDVVGTLAEMILEIAKLKLQVLDQTTIIENLRTDRNNYRNLYEDLKQHPGIMNINKQAEPISKPYKPCKNLRPESE